jgi:hypothetical protein
MLTHAALLVAVQAQLEEEAVTVTEPAPLGALND